jgi:hypothetical protein
VEGIHDPRRLMGHGSGVSHANGQVMSEPDQLPSIWDKVDYTLIPAPIEPKPKATQDEETKWQRLRWKATIRALDVAGSLFWLYVVIKLFFADVDVYFVHRYLPSLHWLVDFRFLLFLFVLLVVTFLFRKWYPLALAYILFFPFVVLFWKLPRLLHRRGSWDLAFGVLHVFVAAVLNLRYTLSVVLLTVLGTVLIAASSPSSSFLSIGRGLLLVVVILALYRALRYAVLPRRFIASQRSLIDRLSESEHFQSFYRLDEELRNPAVEKFNKAQLDQFSTKIGMGLLFHRAVYFWAYRLDRYRRSPAAIVFSAVSVVWLFLLMFYCFTLVNISIYKADHAQFAFEQAPSNMRFAYYTLVGLFANEITGLTPDGTLSTVVKIAMAVCGVLVFLTLVVTLFLSYRQSRDEQAARDAINEIKQRGQAMEREMEEQFQVTPEEAMRRLEDLRYGLLGAIGFFGRRVPDDFWKS